MASRSATTLVATLLAGITHATLCYSDETNIQAVLEASFFERFWSPPGISVFECTRRCPAHCEVTLSMHGGPFSEVRVQVKRSREEVGAEFVGGLHTPFCVVGDKLIYVIYSPSTTGGRVVAVDLQSGKQMWSTRLKAFQWFDHSNYWSTMTISPKGTVVYVAAEELHGKYVEVFDAETGVCVASRIFEDPEIRKKAQQKANADPRGPAAADVIKSR